MGADAVKNDSVMVDPKILVSAIQDFERGGIQSDDFLKKAHLVYNACATFPPTCLVESEHPYLLGCVFAYFAKYYSNNIDYYTSIIENALFCFCRVMKENLSESESQCASIRMLLLIEDNEWVMKGIVHKFCEQRCQELYGQPLVFHRMLAQSMDAWAFEMDVLKLLAFYCIERSSSKAKHSFISSSDTSRYMKIVKSGKYGVEWPLVQVSMEQVYEMFSEFVRESVNTPFERRIAQLYRIL